MPSDAALDALLTDALMQQQRSRPPRMLPQSSAKTQREIILKESFQSTFSKPENWAEKRTLALIHKADDGQLTLLGAFREFIHRRISTARKLVRIDAPSPCEGEEIVSGPEWFGAPPPVPTIDNPEGLETRQLSLDISLRDLEASARSVPLSVSLRKGFIDCVQLSEPTRFSCIQGRHQIFLPQGLKILDGMTLESKVSLKEALANG